MREVMTLMFIMCCKMKRKNSVKLLDLGKQKKLAHIQKKLSKKWRNKRRRGIDRMSCRKELKSRTIALVFIMAKIISYIYTLFLSVFFLC